MEWIRVSFEARFIPREFDNARMCVLRVAVLSRAVGFALPGMSPRRRNAGCSSARRTRTPAEMTGQVTGLKSPVIWR